jgi:four helix bundle protein
MQDFRDLKVWQRAHELTLGVYRTTASFPSDERFGLISQLRRSAASVPANIAEGRYRGSDADFGRFLQIALGSAAETEYHLILARDLGMASANDAEQLLAGIEEVKKMLTSLLLKLKADG